MNCIYLFNKEFYILYNDKGTEYKSNEDRKTFNNDFVFKLIENNWTILILEMNFIKTDQLINFLQKNKIKKIVFIINDVFRINHKKKFVPPLGAGFIENELNNLVFSEIEIIKDIIKKCKILEHKIYHCEIIPKYIQNFINLEIDYYDLFLYQWISHQRRNLDIFHHANFNYKVSSLSLRFDYHRTMLSACFFENKDFVYTHANFLDKDYFFKNSQLDLNKFSNNFKNLLHNQCNKFYNTLPNISIPQLDFNLINTESSIKLNSFIQDSFVHLITETRYTSPMQNISEKSIRPIIAKRPCNLAGSPGSLKLLRDLGFKTFNRWWSEDYDNEFNHHKRLEMIYNLINDILNTDKQKLKNMLNEMQDILDYNYKVYLNFKTKNYKNIN
jgi:hypothetical protein